VLAVGCLRHRRLLQLIGQVGVRGGHRGHPVCPGLLDQVRGPAVQLAAPNRGQCPVDGLPLQAMDESDDPDRLFRSADHQPRSQRRDQCRVRYGHFGQRADRREWLVVVQHRQGVQQVPGVGRQLGDRAADRVDQRARHGERQVIQRVGRQLAQQCPQVERVPAGVVQQALRGPPGDVGAEGGRRQVGHLADRQPGQLQHGHVPVARLVGQACRSVLARPGHHDGENLVGPHPAQHKGQCERRRAVHPLQIVEHERHG
jgi:hypothetical protein